MLGNRHEAEDVAQEVFITVFKTVDTFRGEAKFSTWLLRIAANQSKNRIKYLARRPTDGGELDDAAPAQRVRRDAGADRAGADRRAGRAARGGRDGAAHADGHRRARRGAPPAGDFARRRRDVISRDRGDHRPARGDDQIAPAPGPHGDQRRARQAHASTSWTTPRRRTNSPTLSTGRSRDDQARGGRAAPGDLHPVPHGAGGVQARRLARSARLKQTAPPSFLPDVKQQIYKRSHGRFFAPRWKLFGRIPFEWISLAHDHRDARLLPGRPPRLAGWRPRRAIARTPATAEDFSRAERAEPGRSDHVAEQDLEVLALR